MFINNVSKCLKYSKIKLYAIHIKLNFHFRCDNWSELMQVDLAAIFAWVKMWQ